jgi:hypothetical protein
VWERAPSLDSEGRPRNFLDVEVTGHLSFWRAAVAAVSEQDPVAGLLVSMHGAGIYTGRYGISGANTIASGEAVEAVRDFVGEQERFFTSRAREVGLDDDERWRAYALLQVLDRLSLFFCFHDLDVENEADAIELGPAGGDDLLELEPLGLRHVRLNPYPLAESPIRVTVIRRRLPAGRWADGDAFRADLAAAAPETVELTLER